MLHPDHVSFLFSPMEGSFPVVFLSESLIVRHADSLAQSAGIREGFSFFSFLSAESLALHRKCLQKDTDSRFQAEQTPQNSLLLPLEKFPVYTLLYLEYAYAPQGVLIRASLFPDRQKYRSGLSRSDRGTLECLRQMRRMDFSLNERYEALLRAEKVHSEDMPVFQLHQAAQLTAQCLTYPSPAEDAPLFDLREILHNYKSRVFPQFCFARCELILEPMPDLPVFARLEPDRFLLLLTALFSTLSALAKDDTVRISLQSIDDTAVLTMTLLCPSLAGRLLRCSDIQILLSRAPGKQTALTLADHLIAFSGYEPFLCGHPEEDTISLSLNIPPQKISPEFKSPEYARSLLEHAIPAARGLFAYLLLLSDTEEQE